MSRARLAQELALAGLIDPSSGLRTRTTAQTVRAANRGAGSYFALLLRGRDAAAFNSPRHQSERRRP